MILTKAQERRIREVIRAVHEKRLGDSLAQIEEAIREWREGAVSAFAVDDAIRKHTEQARKFFIHYANTAASAPEAVGILDEAVILGVIGKEEYAQLTTLKKN
jgi:hypothetical protein